MTSASLRSDASRRIKLNRLHDPHHGTSTHARSGSDMRPDERDTVVISMQFSPLAPSTIAVVVSTRPRDVPAGPVAS